VPEALPRADALAAPLRDHHRALADARPGRAPLRQRHERGAGDCRLAVPGRTAGPGADDAARGPHESGTGLYLCRPDGRLPERGRPGANPGKEPLMDPKPLFAIGAMIVAGLTTALGALGPAFGQGRAVDSALDAIARQPDASDRISRTLFIGLAMIESLAIYCLVIALILLLANPFLDWVQRS